MPVLDQRVVIPPSIENSHTVFEVRSWPLRFLNVIGIGSFIFGFNLETCCYMTMRSSTVENGIPNTVQQVRSQLYVYDRIVAAVVGCLSVTIFIGWMEAITGYLEQRGAGTSDSVSCGIQSICYLRLDAPR
ncbi:hypothetical protein F5887DRAFT_230528 [Amanita rubescens]|nr:hypothetical protein F5887DRAFT_230528 [Amanita rubescens]